MQTERLEFKLTKKLKEHATKIAKEREISVAELTRRALEKEVNVCQLVLDRLRR